MGVARLVSIPRKLYPPPGRLPEYALAVACPHCGTPTVIVWVQDAKGGWHARAIAARSWHGETIYVPSKHVFHGIHCLYAKMT